MANPKYPMWKKSPLALAEKHRVLSKANPKRRVPQKRGLLPIENFTALPVDARKALQQLRVHSVQQFLGRVDDPEERKALAQYLNLDRETMEFVFSSRRRHTRYYPHRKILKAMQRFGR